MDESPAEAPIDVVQALKRAILWHGPTIHRPIIHKPVLHRPVIRRQKFEAKVKKTDKDSAKLIKITAKAHETLFMANTVFPFTLFPDTVTVDREKLTIAHRFFFGVAKITSVPIRDILSVEADVGPFFGSVHMSSRYFISNPYSVNYLWRGDALRVQRLLQGYIIAHEQELDCSKMDKEELIILLEDLGKGDTG